MFGGLDGAQPTENMAGMQLQKHVPTLTQILEDKRKRLADELQQCEDALGALKANPEIERVLNMVQRAARY